MSEDFLNIPEGVEDFSSCYNCLTGRFMKHVFPRALFLVNINQTINAHFPRFGKMLIKQLFEIKC